MQQLLVLKQHNLQKKFIFYWNSCKAFQKKKVKKNKKKILIVGGSQGAKIFSKIIPKILLQMPQNVKKK